MKASDWITWEAKPKENGWLEIVPPIDPNWTVEVKGQYNSSTRSQVRFVDWSDQGQTVGKVVAYRIIWEW